MFNKSAAASLVHPGIRAALGLLITLSLAILGLAATTEKAWAEPQNQPSVLLLEAGLGDYSQFSSLWLGQDTEELATEGALSLTTAANPSWWAASGGQGSAPATFILGSTKAGSAITADSIVWALDQIKAFGAQPKTFIVAAGSPGLSLREYVEDLAATKQSTRADVVGVAFCATPHNGYSAMATYSELTMWDTIAQATGKQRADLAPQSTYLGQLDSASFPSTVKTLSLSGVIGDLGFGGTDGAGVTADYTLNPAVTNQVQTAEVKATVGQDINLTSQWHPFTDEISHRDRLVDANLVELLSSSVTYATSSEVPQQVQEFYSTWFANTLPVTHISNVVALDLSGSMREEIVPGSIKIDGAKNAAKEYLRAVEAFESMPYASPVNISITGFSTTLGDITSGYDDAARNAIGSMEASRNETNIGIALNDALTKLESTPACADKRILLLSDGATTEGLTNEEMLSGPVAQASNAGIVIDTIGFGDVGESNSSFLDQVAKATGGTYYRAQDTYELEVNFLRSYYTSLGLALVDEELPSGDPKSIALGTTDNGTIALGIGIVGDGFTPEASLLCNGELVDPSTYTIQEEGKFVALQLSNPAAGEYTLEVKGSQNAAHAFAVTQQGMVKTIELAGAQTDNSLLFLIGTGVVFLAALIAVIVRTLSKNKAS